MRLIFEKYLIKLTILKVSLFLDQEWLMKTTNETKKKSRKRIVPEELNTVSGGSDKSGPQTGAVAPRSAEGVKVVIRDKYK